MPLPIIFATIWNAVCISAMNKKKRGVPQPSGVLERVLTGAQAAITAIDSGSVTLDDLLDRAPEDCRRMLEHLLMQFYRYRKSIRGAWQKFCRKMPSVHISSLLDAAVTQCLFQSQVNTYSVVNVAVMLARTEHADKFVNAVLRSVLREGYNFPKTAQEILPDAVLKRWKKSFASEDIQKFAELFLLKPPFTFRLCGKNAELLPEKSSEISAFDPFRFAAGSAAAVLDSKEFAAGKYYIQDPAASMAVSLAKNVLPECKNLLDLCAAPGGKTLMAAELLPAGAQITAADISEKRQKLTAENFKLREIEANIVTAKPEELQGSFDFVIADVPCSNTGVFRHRPDALWRFSEKSLAEVMELQKHIVAEAARLTGEGGYLLLSTCSIEADENNALSEQLKGFTLVESRTLLPEREHDGAFAALWRKNCGIFS